jgi:hypothetical protein
VAARLDFSGGGLPIGHAAQADARDLKSGLAKIDVVHSFSTEVLNSLLEMQHKLFCSLFSGRSIWNSEDGGWRIQFAKTSWVAFPFGFGF